MINWLVMQLKGIIDYQKNKGKKSYLVLSMVKKYPLYSVNKLAEELPGISRHSIQRILEKNNLSTAEQRLAFADRKAGFLNWHPKLKIPLANFLKPGQILLEKWRRPFGCFQQKPWRGIFLAVLVLICWQGASFIFANSPEIKLYQPKLDSENKSEKVFVSGKVVPSNSAVTVNGKPVSLNGDGSFTAVVPVPVGESILKVEATYKRKKAQVLQMVGRTLTEAEQLAQEEKLAEEKKEAMDKTAAVDRKVKDLLAAKNANSGQKQGLLRVLNSRINQQSGFSSAIGEILNQGSIQVDWVMITARFYDQFDRELDAKYGFATDFGEVVKPGQIVKFETQATQKEFDHYSLELSWEEAAVAGASVGLSVESGGKASVSGQIQDEGE